MSETTRQAHTVAVKLNVKSVALPVEHGGWGMLGEPLLLGLLIAPSWAGLGVALASLAAFLVHHPLKLALADRRRGSTQPRTAAALGFILLYGVMGAAGLALAGRGQRGWWLPWAAAAPLALAHLAYGVRNQSRQLLPELLGSVALSSVVAAEMRAAGLPLGPCLAAWAVFAAKAMCGVLYVRTRLRLDRGLSSDRAAPLTSHAGSLLLAAGLGLAGYIPWLVTPGFILLMARAIHGLSRFHRRTRPQAVGMLEMAYGFSFVVIVSVGYALGF